jgi:hypothetical protein
MPRLPRFLAWLLLCAPACTLTGTDVEPPLPLEPVSGQPTVAYQLDGLPVVANNSFDLGTIFVSFFAGNREYPVEAELLADSTLVLSAIDSQRDQSGGDDRLQKVQHGLQVQVPRFRGVGSYAQLAVQFAERTRPAPDQPWREGRTLTAAPGAAQRFTVTEWKPAERQLRGTFELTLLDSATGQRRTIKEGWFFALTRY